MLHFTDEEVEALEVVPGLLGALGPVHGHLTA